MDLVKGLNRAINRTNNNSYRDNPYKKYIFIILL